MFRAKGKQNRERFPLAAAQVGVTSASHTWWPSASSSPPSVPLSNPWPCSSETGMSCGTVSQALHKSREVNTSHSLLTDQLCSSLKGSHKMCPQWSCVSCHQSSPYAPWDLLCKLIQLLNGVESFVPFQSNNKAVMCSWISGECKV